MIASETVRRLKLAGESRRRRFRPNIVVRLLRPNPFEEDEWLGGVLLRRADRARVASRGAMPLREVPLIQIRVPIRRCDIDQTVRFQEFVEE